MNSKTGILPAVVIGGPPHSGKSVLAYSLTQALRRRNVPHYLLRAYPDGEGDWANQADPELVRALRVKGDGSPEWIHRITRDIAARPLPLIVDPGGKPTAWQEAVFRECTHGILLCPDDASRQEWRARFNANDLVLLADLKSELDGANTLTSEQGPLRGTLAGLERGHTAAGPAFDRLTDWLARLFAYSASELEALHLKQAPAELVIDLQRLGAGLAAVDSAQQWLPEALPRVLDYLPQGQPLAIFGRGPNWLYAALGVHAYPASFYQFDLRLGWLSPPRLKRAAQPQNAMLAFRTRSKATHSILECHSATPYLDYLDAMENEIPELDPGHGVLLSGKLPLWMYTALAVAYRDAAWVAVYQPHLDAQAIVVHSRVTDVRIGDLVPHVVTGRISTAFTPQAPRPE